MGGRTSCPREEMNPPRRAHTPERNCQAIRLIITTLGVFCPLRCVGGERLLAGWARARARARARASVRGGVRAEARC